MISSDVSVTLFTKRVFVVLVIWTTLILPAHVCNSESVIKLNNNNNINIRRK